MFEVLSITSIIGATAAFACVKAESGGAIWLW